MEEREKPNIIEAFHSPELFGPVFAKPESWKNWLTFLKVLYGIEMFNDERQLFQECTKREEPGRGFNEAYAVVGRRGGKSRIASFVAVYEAIFGDWEKYLARGESANIFLIATDRTQAKISLDYCRGMLELFPDIVGKELQWEIRLQNRLIISVKTASFVATRGYGVAMVILDELAYFRSENSANPAEEIVNSLIPGLLPGAKLLGISSPYGRFGYFYQTYKENFGVDDSDILIWQAGTKTMNPSYQESLLKRMFARDRQAYRAEYDAQFREDIETYLGIEDLAKVIEVGVPLRLPI